MNSLFEYSDSLQTPYECFLFDTAVENFPIHPHWHYFMEIIYMVEGFFFPIRCMPSTVYRIRL